MVVIDSRVLDSGVVLGLKLVDSSVVLLGLSSSDSSVLIDAGGNGVVIDVAILDSEVIGFIEVVGSGVEGAVEVDIFVSSITDKVGLFLRYVPI